MLTMAEADVLMELCAADATIFRMADVNGMPDE